MTLDPEIYAMNRVNELFRRLDMGQRKRVVDWVNARFNLSGFNLQEEISPAYTPPPPRLTTTEIVETTLNDPNLNEAETNNPGVQEATQRTPEQRSPEASLDLTSYNSLEDLMAVAKIKTNNDRILLTAAYMQVKRNLTDITSFDINNELKKIESGINNISLSINRLLAKVPILMVITRKEGNTKQARRNFKVTQEGMQKVYGYLKE